MDARRLASEVHVSRATLARRFAEAVGEPPLAYLARWRMHLAAHRLRYSTDTVETIAHAVGYTSEYAFNRAFAATAASHPAATGARSPQQRPDARRYSSSLPSRCCALRSCWS